MAKLNNDLRKTKRLGGYFINNIIIIILTIIYTFTKIKNKFMET